MNQNINQTPVDPDAPALPQAPPTPQIGDRVEVTIPTPFDGDRLGPGENADWQAATVIHKFLECVGGYGGPYLFYEVTLANDPDHLAHRFRGIYVRFPTETTESNA